MTLDELRAWLKAGVGSDPSAVARAHALLAAAGAGDSGALRTIADLRARETVIVTKFDKTHVTVPGVDGLAPYETVIAEFVDGRVISTTTVAADEEPSCR